MERSVQNESVAEDRRPFVVAGTWKSGRRGWLTNGLSRTFREHGWEQLPSGNHRGNGVGERSGANSGQEQGDSAGNEEGGATGRRGDAEAATPRLVLNGVGVEAPQPYRRKAQGTFVLTIVDADEPPTDVLRTTYPILVRNLSNMVMYVVWSGEQCSAHFVTLELGHYYLTYRGDEARFFRRIYEMLYPLVTAELVINNEFCPDLPPDLWAGDATTRSITRAGQQLDAWNLLPAPFPIDELVPARDLRHIQLLYGIGGLSYGNISAREDASRFWMSASGVNKADLRVIGRDILLVKGFDAARNVILLSVPPRIKPRRVSVDAIEHWMIYTEHPEVHAILHVHAWVEGVPSTVINYPCGTRQLARAVAALVRQADDPARAIIGLKNHGLTITGRSLDEIFERIRGRINQEVPMEPPAISDEEPVST